MKVVSVINHKGGVGKTTFAGSIAQALALCGFRVLAIDNDSQHNLSSMLGAGVQSPNIRDVYLAAPEQAPRVLLQAVRTTFLKDLSIITSCRELAFHDAGEESRLRTCFELCGLQRFFDYVLIDNAPGLDTLQACAMAASDELFVPTELGQFAVDGIVEMERMVSEHYPNSARITRIIPNFYRNVKRHNSYISALNRLFPGRVTATAIPLDPVFDELVTDGKTLFLHRLRSKGAAYYLKLVHELFNFSEDELWQTMLEKRKKRIGDEARERLLERRTRQEVAS